MKLFKAPLFSFVFFLLMVTFSIAQTKSSISFKLDGKNFSGNIETAALIKINNENYIQIKAVRNEQIVFLYLKEQLLKGEFPVTLKYKEHNQEKAQTPDAEIVWAPGGGDQPAWNTIEGKAIVTKYDPDAKTVSGTFEFIVEKQDYSTKKDQKKEKAEIENGLISNIQFVLDVSAAGK